MLLLLLLYKVFTDISKGAKIFSPPFHAKKPFFCSFFFFFFFFICFFTFSPLSLQQTDMEEAEETNTRNRKCTAKTSFRHNTNKQPVHNHHHHHHHHHHLYHHNQILHHHHHHHQSNRIHLGFFNQYHTYPPLLPLPPTIPLNFAANTTTPPFPQNHNNNNFRSKTHLQKPSRTSSNSQFQHMSVAPPGTCLFSSSRIHDFVKRFDFY